jgi:transcriptional regulator
MSEANRKLAKTIFKLRQYGWTYQKIADELGLTLPLIMQFAKRETTYRCKAFKHPFIEYISPRTGKAIKRRLGEDILAEPEKLNGMGQVKAVRIWPGASDGVMKDLAEALEEAGYESFDVEKMKGFIFMTKQKARRMQRERSNRLGN